MLGLGSSIRTSASPGDPACAFGRAGAERAVGATSSPDAAAASEAVPFGNSAAAKRPPLPTAASAAAAPNVLSNGSGTGTATAAAVPLMDMLPPWLAALPAAPRRCTEADVATVAATEAGDAARRAAARQHAGRTAGRVVQRTAELSLADR
eukprot:347464-Chlamydomonas_euryale.AAC.13